MRALALALAAAVVFPTAVGAQQPKPQYTPEQLEQGLSQPPAAASDECAANGMATAPDGTCQPLVGAKRGFSLVRPKTPPAPETPGARSRLITGGSRVIAAQPHGLDLQITFGNGSAVLTDQAKANSRVFAKVPGRPVRYRRTHQRGGGPGLQPEALARPRAGRGRLPDEPGGRRLAVRGQWLRVRPTARSCRSQGHDQPPGRGAPPGLTGNEDAALPLGAWGGGSI